MQHYIPFVVRCTLLLSLTMSYYHKELSATIHNAELFEKEQNDQQQPKSTWTRSKKIALAFGGTIGLALCIDLFARTKDSLLATGWSKLTGGTPSSQRGDDPTQTDPQPGSPQIEQAQTRLPHGQKAIPLGTASARKPQIDYFARVMGRSEADVVATLEKRLKAKGLTFKWFRKTPAEHKEIVAVMDELFPPDKRPASVTQGDFQTYTIQSLIDETESAEPVGDKASFTILFDPQKKKSRIEYLQALPENRDALFQLASNHNALEAHSHGNTCGGILNHWACGVQGELASLSAGGAAIKRIYLTPPLNLLETFDPTNYKTVQVGLHSNILVTSGYLDTTDQYYAIDDPNQVINQAFSFTCDKRGKTGGNHKYDAFLKPPVTMDTLEENLLYAAYEGTLRLAVKAKKKKVFLTLVGGGAFINRLDTIAKAITRMKAFIKAKKLEVVLVYFGDRPHEIIAGENERFKKAMKEMETEINQ